MKPQPTIAIRTIVLSSESLPESDYSDRPRIQSILMEVFASKASG